MLKKWFLMFFLGFSCQHPLNSPYKDKELDPNQKILFSALTDEPRTLDPVKATDSISITILSNITASAYEYDYIARPLRIIPLLAESYPETGFKNYKNQNVYFFRFKIKEAYYYNDVCLQNQKRKISVEDFILTIKRTANRKLNPFAIPLLDQIIGFNEYSEKLEKISYARENSKIYREEIEGVKKWGENGIEILLYKLDPRIKYFFAMTASSPLPFECLDYYANQKEKLMDHHPVSSGAFYLEEWKRNVRMILKRNPNYIQYSEYFKSYLPRIDQVYFSVIRSAPTIWTLFRQGYIDRIGLNQDIMQQVLDGNVLSKKYKNRGIILTQAKEPVTYGWVFNLDDPLFKNNPYLRRAISCSLDIDEMIYRFFRNRAIPANGLIPPEMEGNIGEENPILKKYPIRKCKHLVPELLEKAGYRGGIHPETKKPLLIRLTAVAGAGGTSLYQFYVESLRNSGIDLKIDLYDAPTFFEKRHKREFQMAGWGWGADYPDPQNFFQLFYSKNILAGYNESGFKNVEYDLLYERLLITDEIQLRKDLINRMNEILLQELPVVFTFHPVTFSIQWNWMEEMIPHPLDLNQLKYRWIDPELRNKRRWELNKIL